MPEPTKDIEDAKAKIIEVLTLGHYSTPSEEHSFNLKTVRIPMNKLIPMSFDRLRERIRML